MCACPWPSSAWKRSATRHYNAEQLARLDAARSARPLPDHAAEIYWASAENTRTAHCRASRRSSGGRGPGTRRKHAAKSLHQPPPRHDSPCAAKPAAPADALPRDNRPGTPYRVFCQASMTEVPNRRWGSGSRRPIWPRAALSQSLLASNPVATISLSVFLSRSRNLRTTNSG